MKVGIDITSIIYGRGVSRYTSNLVSQLALRKDVDLVLFGSSLRQVDVLQKFAKKINSERVFARNDIPSLFQKYPPSIMDILWNKLKTNKVRSLLPGITVFHSWDWLQPPDKNIALVSTIHDLAILKYPETVHPKILKQHQQSWKRLKENDAEIIAVSQSTKKDCVELLDIPAARVHVIYEALPKEVIQVAEDLSEDHFEKIKKNLKLDKPYLFFVGTREPRKNLIRLIEAWQEMTEDIELIIAGEEGWDGSGEKNNAVKKPRFLGRVSDKELAVLYSEAEVFVYPSLYEGFGLPILEAFYHGVPVVTSNVSALPEVAGNAAELVDPLSVESIKKGIQKVLNEDREAEQKRMQRMIIRLQLFYWRRAADETIRVYRLAEQRKFGEKNT
ncbi:glycosyltransferase family 1 protein [soil metagenome]